MRVRVRERSVRVDECTCEWTYEWTCEWTCEWTSGSASERASGHAVWTYGRTMVRICKNNGAVARNDAATWGCAV